VPGDAEGLTGHTGGDLYCGKCGALIADGADKCDACGEPINRADERGDSRQASANPPKRIAYAGFWLRAIAFILDLVIITLASFPVLWKLIEENVGPQPSAHDYIAFYSSGTRQAIAFQLLLQLICWLYFAAFESSRWQATPAKRILGLFVTDLNGQRISFARATGRYIGKALEDLTLFIGFAMAGFTAKKQALHDIVASCLVLKKR
jgi:uncharacterized RDD family membrane protein YckC